MDYTPMPAHPVAPPTLQEDQDVNARIAVLRENLDRLEEKLAELMDWFSPPSAQEP